MKRWSKCEKKTMPKVSIDNFTLWHFIRVRHHLGSYKITCSTDSVLQILLVFHQSRMCCNINILISIATLGWDLSNSMSARWITLNRGIVIELLQLYDHSPIQYYSLGAHVGLEQPLSLIFIHFGRYYYTTHSERGNKNKWTHQRR